jgi:hypothetical protein
LAPKKQQSPAELRVLSIISSQDQNQIAFLSFFTTFWKKAKYWELMACAVAISGEIDANGFWGGKSYGSQRSSILVSN